MKSSIKTLAIFVAVVCSAFAFVRCSGDKSSTTDSSVASNADKSPTDTPSTPNSTPDSTAPGATPVGDKSAGKAIAPPPAGAPTASAAKPVKADAVLVGTWGLTLEELPKSVNPQQAAAAKASAEKTTLELKGDGKFSLGAGGANGVAGTWTADKKNVTLNIEMIGGKTVDEFMKGMDDMSVKQGGKPGAFTAKMREQLAGPQILAIGADKKKLTPVPKPGQPDPGRAYFSKKG